MSVDSSVKKVSSPASPSGELGQVYLVSGKRVALRLWRDERPQEKQPTWREYETVGYVLSGRAADNPARLLLATSFFCVRPRRTLTRMLLVPEQAEPISRRGLNGDPGIADSPAAGGGRGAREIGDVGVLACEAGVDVGVHARYRTVTAFLAHVDEVPHAVFLDRSADAA